MMMNDLLVNMSDAMIGFTANALDWIYGLIGAPDLPSFLQLGLEYLLVAVRMGVGLVSWIFPNETVWITYVSFIIDLQLAYVSWLLFKFILATYDKLKP